MSVPIEAFVTSWPWRPWLTLGLVTTALVYVHGWRSFRRHGSPQFHAHHLTAFLGGLLALFVALASPVETFTSLLLSVHMVQHLLLLMIAPLLLLLGRPALPLVLGLPAYLRRNWVAPFAREPAVHALGRFLTTLPVAWLLFVTASWAWHVPALYELALRSDTWHQVEHACFLGTALVFWWPVVSALGQRRAPRWALVPYLFLTDVQNTILCAIFTFSDRALYAHYDSVPQIGVSALEDQETAGLLMWVPGSLALLIPLAFVVIRLLSGRDLAPMSPRSTARTITRRAAPARIALPVLSPPRPRPVPFLDLLRVPFLGRFLRWRHARRLLQGLSLLVALAILVDGLLGPGAAPMNVAGVVPWTYWRWFVVAWLLVAGNLFCMACPFTLPRSLARRWLHPVRAWPRPLRNKLLAVGLLVVFFISYEVFSLWDRPAWTAVIVLGYFLAPLAIDSVFRGAAFCKYVCPVGQFQFVGALVSPLEVRARDLSVCTTCAGKECIRGGAGVSGCETGLYQRRKSGNLDCTFCLDCVHACPHENVGVLATAPGADLVHDRNRSGVGRFGRRPDIAVLALVFVFAAFANAAGMVGPVMEAEQALVERLGLSGPGAIQVLGLFAAVVAAPVILAGGAAWLGRWWSGTRGALLPLAAHSSLALVPLGLGMWLAHYSFHFLSSPDAVVPVLQRVAQDMGVPSPGVPQWACSCCAAAPHWLLPLEIVFLEVGLLFTLYIAYAQARASAGRSSRALRLFLPWAALALVLFGIGLWLLLQPMQMRGTLGVSS